MNVVDIYLRVNKWLNINESSFVRHTSSRFTMTATISVTTTAAMNMHRKALMSTTVMMVTACIYTQNQSQCKQDSCYKNIKYFQINLLHPLCDYKGICVMKFWLLHKNSCVKYELMFLTHIIPCLFLLLFDGSVGVAIIVGIYIALSLGLMVARLTKQKNINISAIKLFHYK